MRLRVSDWTHASNLNHVGTLAEYEGCSTTSGLVVRSRRLAAAHGTGGELLCARSDDEARNRVSPGRGVSGAGVVCVLTFQAKAQGQTNLSITRGGAMNSAGKPLQAQTSQASLTVQ